MTFLRLLDTHSGVDSVRLPYVGWKVPGFDNMMRRVGGGLTSGATVEVGSGWSGVNVLAWDQESLAKHIAANPNLSNVFEAMLAADLVKKLRGAGARHKRPAHFSGGGGGGGTSPGSGSGRRGSGGRAGAASSAPG